ncbi:MAG TPA: hypothetical protein VFG89_01930 [Coriobacteriia bacterium]|nr:hypothetical protein [Coriobacteriia bacterium]
MTTINDRIKQFMTDMASDPLEERVVEYVVREVHNGRRLMEVIDDPYVRNRINEEKRASILESPEIVEALESEIRASMTRKDLDFS